jgi:glyoxylase I family protein
MPTLETVSAVNYVIILCDDFPVMRAFYAELLPFPVETEREDVIAFRAGDILLCVRQRTRPYDGADTPRRAAPGLQLAFAVTRADVDSCHALLVAAGVTILDPPADQFWGHRTLYFADPEGNLLELYAEADE